MKKRILIVDDEENVAFFLKENLIAAEPDYVVEAVESGEAALSRLKEQSFNLVITDLKMPGMDGLALVKYLGSHYPGIAFIVMTGYHSLDQKAEVYRSGVYHYITKPFQIETLIDMIHTILAEPQKPSSGRRLSTEVKGIHRKRVLILSDNEGLAKSIGLSLNYSLHVETSSLLSHTSYKGGTSNGWRGVAQVESLANVTSPSEQSFNNPDAEGDTHHPCDLIVVALSSPLNAPIVVLARASLLRNVGQIPVLIISERPFLADPDVQITHLSFPFNTDKLKESVSRILHDPGRARLSL
jgi:CheY-like chemotaxis protein